MGISRKGRYNLECHNLRAAYPLSTIDLPIPEPTPVIRLMRERVGSSSYDQNMFHHQGLSCRRGQRNKAEWAALRRGQGLVQEIFDIASEQAGYGLETCQPRKICGLGYL